jgi:hypothetical protein
MRIHLKLVLQKGCRVLLISTCNSPAGNGQIRYFKSSRAPTILAEQAEPILHPESHHINSKLFDDDFKHLKTADFS